MNRWTIRAGAGAALLALAVAGCGGSGSSSGTSPAAPRPTAAGPACPLRFDVTGGQRDFSGYGAAVHIVAPAGATDLSNG
jgi:hypothetical protein